MVSTQSAGARGSAGIICGHVDRLSGLTTYVVRQHPRPSKRALPAPAACAANEGSWGDGWYRCGHFVCFAA